MMLVSKSPKFVVLAAIFIVLGLSYALMVRSVDTGTSVSEQHFGEARTDAMRQLRVYVEVLAIDAVNDSLRMRVSFAPSPALRGARAGSPDMNLNVRAGDPDAAQEFTFRTGEPMNAAVVEADLDDGTIGGYPLDRYTAAFQVVASDASGAAVPVQVSVWEAVPGWSPRVAQVPGDGGTEVKLRFDVRRSGALRLLVLAIYGEMVLLAIVALTIGCRTFLGLRPPESTLTGALTGMVFSLPVLRYALPGAPPLGVRADLLIFFWAELAVFLGLALFVTTWAQVKVKT